MKELKMIDEFLELVKNRACCNPPCKYPDDDAIDTITKFENAAYIQGFSDALKLIAFLP